MVKDGLGWLIRFNHLFSTIDYTISDYWLMIVVSNMINIVVNHMNIRQYKNSRTRTSLANVNFTLQNTGCNSLHLNITGKKTKTIILFALDLCML